MVRAIESIIPDPIMEKQEKILSLFCKNSFLCVLTQSCPGLCSPLDCNPPGSSVHGIFKAGILEWGAFSFSRGSSPPRYGTGISCISYIGWRTVYHQRHLRSPQNSLRTWQILQMGESTRHRNWILINIICFSWHGVSYHNSLCRKNPCPGERGDRKSCPATLAERNTVFTCQHGDLTKWLLWYHWSNSPSRCPILVHITYKKECLTLS